MIEKREEKSLNCALKKPNTMKKEDIEKNKAKGRKERLRRQTKRPNL
jgi:hypothetical protein